MTPEFEADDRDVLKSLSAPEEPGALKIPRRMLLGMAAVASQVVGAGVMAGTACADGRTASSSSPVRRAYIDSPYGQLHYQTAGPASASPGSTPLLMLHQSPLSSMEFGPLIAEMAKDRVVVALDTPGQGQSDGPDTLPTIGELANAMAGALRSMGFGHGRPLDVIGNHTGTFIATEIAVRHPDLIRRMVLNGIYIVSEAHWRGFAAKLRVDHSSAEFFEDMSSSIPVFRDHFTSVGLSDAQWGQLLVSTLRPLDRREYGHFAAFNYIAEAPGRLALITQPVTLLLIDDLIADATMASIASFTTPPQLVRRMDWKDGYFYTQTAEVALLLRTLLA